MYIVNKIIIDKTFITIINESKNKLQKEAIWLTWQTTNHIFVYSLSASKQDELIFSAQTASNKALY